MKGKRNKISKVGMLPRNATKDVVAFGADSAKKKPFTLRHYRNWNILYTNKYDHCMDCRESGQKMAKNCRYTLRQLIIDQADTRSSYCPKITAQFPHQIHWQLLFDFSFILKLASIVPDAHYEKHNYCKNQNNPTSISHTPQNWREKDHFQPKEEY